MTSTIRRLARPARHHPQPSNPKPATLHDPRKTQRRQRQRRHDAGRHRPRLPARLAPQHRPRRSPPRATPRTSATARPTACASSRIHHDAVFYAGAPDPDATFNHELARLDAVDPTTSTRAGAASAITRTASLRDACTWSATSTRSAPTSPAATTRASAIASPATSRAALPPVASQLVAAMAVARCLEAPRPARRRPRRTARSRSPARPRSCPGDTCQPVAAGPAARHRGDRQTARRTMSELHPCATLRRSIAPRAARRLSDRCTRAQAERDRTYPHRPTARRHLDDLAAHHAPAARRPRLAPRATRD